ncbi:hypothetical protein AWC38_SpisGene21070 [Stylophora pistillata]|uniref:Uncharacterized protein n=1 Tax=Stylophora pistillata TaxID=50429 RepID=A0A2B4RE40_STYPI|nr:hypothetical protein AWC38_SpisGene21070 [Stylophora pistillata]
MEEESSRSRPDRRMHPQNEEPKKNWVKNKNSKNLTLDVNSSVLVMLTPITIMQPSGFRNPEVTSEEPLRQLAKLVESVKPEYAQEGPQVQPQVPPQVQRKEDVMEEGEISEAGNFQYGTLEELLADVGVCYPRPIHNVGMHEVHSQKEWLQNVYFTCPIDVFPVAKSVSLNVIHEMTKTERDEYESPGHIGSLGGIQPYAKSQRIPLSQAKKELERNLAYTLHKPRRRRGEFAPVVVFDIDEQFLEATGCLYRKGGNMIRAADWGHGKNCTLFAWSNVANGRHDDPILLPKEAGFINIQLKCTAQAAQRTIVIYSEIESMLEIDGFKGGVSMDVY